jgi:PBSX family phage terminase large subunit
MVMSNVVKLPPIKAWPSPKPGMKYGPLPKQAPIFIHTMKPEDRPHKHSVDVVLLHGAAGSSKTAAEIAQGTELVSTYPNMKAVIGGKNYPLLKRNIVAEFAQRFSAYGTDWDHPIVKKRPTQNEMVMKTVIGSQLSFLNLDKYLVARGFDADFVVIEEVNLMDAQSFDEMIRRSRGRALPIRQFLLSMNPTGERDWVYDKFSLQQFEEGYDGPPIPIGEPCTCQYCNMCFDVLNEKIEWVNGYCPNPNCPSLINFKIVNKKETDCPGNQHYWRVILSTTFDNPHNPSDYVQLMRSTLDPDSYKMYVEGKILQLRKGKVYKQFSSLNNVFPKDIPLNWERDIIWTHDFNINPMCSQICQETDWGIHVVDEIIKWDANEEQVAREFVKRYSGFSGTVHIFGDPAGLWGSGKSESKRTSYQILVDYLKQHHINAVVEMKKIKGETRISIKDRVNNTNAMCCNAKGEVRLKINPSCMHIIQSLSSVNWNDDGTKEDDKCDDRARENARRDTFAPIMTHPSCALGYMITKKFPIIIKKPAGNYAQFADATLKTENQDIIKEKHEIEELKQKESSPNKENPVFKSILSDKGFIIESVVLNERLKYEKQLEEERQVIRDKLIQELMK